MTSKWIHWTYTSMDTLDKGVIHFLGRTEWNSSRFHVSTYNGNLKHEWFISRIFYVISLDCRWPCGKPTADKGGLLSKDRVKKKSLPTIPVAYPKLSPEAAAVRGFCLSFQYYVILIHSFVLWYVCMSMHPSIPKTDNILRKLFCTLLFSLNTVS